MKVVILISLLFLFIPLDNMYTNVPQEHPLNVAGYETTGLVKETEDYPMPVGNFGNFFMSYGKDGMKKQAIYNNYWDSVGGTYSNGDADLNNFFSLELGGKKWVLQERGFEEYENTEMRAYFLFPLAYYEFDEMPINMTLFSPFIFHDVKNSTVPAYCFVFYAENSGDDVLEFSLTSHFENVIGWRDQDGERDSGGNFNQPVHGENYAGFFLSSTDQKKNTNYEGDVTIFTTPEGCSLREKGASIEIIKSVSLQPGERVEIPFVLATYFPLFNPGGRVYSPRWNESWKVSGDHEWFWADRYNSSKEVAIEALENYNTWLEKIEEQQRDIMDAVKDPEVSKVLLNSLHTIGTESFYSKERHFFTVEGEFTLLHTMDVMLYSHPFMAEFFPEIGKDIVREYCIAMDEEGRVPHSLWYDYAENHEEPYFTLIAYMSSRDDEEFCGEVYPYVKKAMLFRLGTDVGEDILIHNLGADHSYDMWSAPTMSYINSLWLISLKLSSEMADELGFHEDSIFFGRLFDIAQRSFIEKLWNGDYFNLCYGRYGTLPILERRDIGMKVPILDRRASHVEQISGVVFAALLGESILPEEYSKKATLHIYENNFDTFRGLGWINGVLPHGSIDFLAVYPLYSTMIWSGAQWVLAAQLHAMGFGEEASRVAEITARNQLYRGFGLFHLGEGYSSLIGTTNFNFPLVPSNENFVLLKPSLYPAYPRIMACWLYYLSVAD